MIRKAVSLLLAFVMCALALCVGSFAADSDNAVAGEVPRAAFSLAEGVDVAFYRLGASSRYGAARFSVLTFDVSRDDLLLDVSRGLSAIRAPEGMRAIGAVQAAATDSASFAMDRGAISCADGVSFEICCFKGNPCRRFLLCGLPFSCPGLRLR